MIANTIIGPYKVGEIPAPIVCTIEDSNGDFIPLGGFTVDFIYRQADHGSVTRSAALVTAGSTGQVQYTWEAGDFTTAGYFEGEFWCGNSTNRYASVTFGWEVLDAVTDSTPAI